MTRSPLIVDIGSEMMLAKGIRESNILNARIDASDVLLFVLVALLLMPSFFANSVFDYFENGVAALAACYLLIRRHRPGKVAILISLYYLGLIALTFINASPNADIHFLVSRMKMVVLFLLVDCCYARDKQRTVAILFWIMLLLVAADVVSVFLFPDGLYSSAIVWNEWTSSERAQWILGNKNSKAGYYVLFLLLIGLHYALSDKRYLKQLGLAVLIIQVIAIFVVQSSTSIVAVLVAGLGLLLFLNGKTLPKPIVSMKFVAVVYLVVFFVLIFSSMSVFQNITEFLFQKDSTFSGRTYIWQAALEYISQKPILGWGYYDGTAASQLYGSASFTSAHNQILNTAFEGGVLLLGMLVWCFVSVFNAIDSLKGKAAVYLLGASVLALMVETFFESIMSGAAPWLILLLCALFARGVREQVGLSR